MKNGQRVIGITLLGMIILAGCMLASVAYGSNLIPIGQVLQALQNPDSGTFEASVVWARIPRTVFGRTGRIRCSHAGCDPKPDC